LKHVFIACDVSCDVFFGWWHINGGFGLVNVFGFLYVDRFCLPQSIEYPDPLADSRPRPPGTWFSTRPKSRGFPEAQKNNAAQ
jgi:hypothetical protein